MALITRLDFIQRFGELESFFGNGSHVTSQGPHQRASKLGGGNWGTLRIPSEDLGTLGMIRGITTTPLRILLIYFQKHLGW